MPQTLNTSDIIVIGASAGGVEALMGLFRELPIRISAAILVVIHLGKDSPGFLDGLLARASGLPVAKAVDGEIIERGRAYIGIPEHHLVVEHDRIRVRATAREYELFRPSVDVLFRSAAAAYGPRVVGVVLSGTLHDGTDGLRHISAAGGLSVVQDPEEAAFDGMPRSAMAHDHVQYCLPVREIARLLIRLSAGAP